MDGAELGAAKTTAQERPPRRRLNEVATEVICRYGPQLMQDARRYSRSTEDAEDAYQRSLEVLLTKAPSDDPDELGPWLRTVVRHQALTIKRERPHWQVGLEPEKLDHFLSEQGDPSEVVEDAVEIYMGFEALGRLTPAQITCMLAQAEGLTYDEIAERTGFSRRKVSRSLERGRAAFANRFNSIAQGRECQRMRPLIWKVLASDTEAALELRPHLRHCVGCRMILRAYETAPRDVAALLPPALVLTGSSGASVVERAEAWIQALADRVAVHLMGADRWTEVATAKKAVAVVAVTATTAGGGVAVEQGIERARESRADAVAAERRAAAPAYTRPTMYDRVKPAPRPARAKPKKKKQATTRAATPVPTPRQAAAPEPAPATTIDDGSAEFAPEARSR